MSAIKDIITDAIERSRWERSKRVLKERLSLTAAVCSADYVEAVLLALSAAGYAVVLVPELAMPSPQEPRK